MQSDKDKPKTETPEVSSSNRGRVAPPPPPLPHESRVPPRGREVTPPPLPRGPEGLSTPALVEKILKDASELAKAQVDLARVELRADVKAEVAAAKELSVGALAAFVGVNLLLVTAILALAIVLPGWAAGLIVSGVVIVVAAVAAGMGWGKRVRVPMRRSRREVKEDVRWTKEKVA
jgi:hypothetical protein